MSMSQIDPNTPDTDDVDDDNLTEAERQALADTEPDPEPDPAPQAAADADPDPAPAAPDPADRIGAAADKLSAAAERLASRVEPDPEPEPDPAPADPARDFEAELKALKEEYEEGRLDMDEYLGKRDDIRDERSDARLEARLAAEREQQTAEQARLSQEATQQRWKDATTEFFADPTNAALVDNPIKTGAFQAAIQEAGKQVPQGDFNAVLAKARELVGGAPVSDVDVKLRDAKHQRIKGEPEPAPTLRDVPNAASHETPGAMLDGMEISDLEDKVMQMTPEARDRWLATAPGGLGDNPRRAD